MRKKMICTAISILLIFNLVFTIAPTMEVYAVSQSSVTQKLDTLINQYANKTATTQQMYMGTQCKGFANWVFREIFGVYIGPYPEAANYKINNAQAQTIGIINPGSLTQESAKDLLMKAKPGDYIQVQRSIAKSKGKCGPHSMIVVNVKADGVEVFDCNSDGRNTIKTYLYTWSKFDYDNRAMSLYHANGYTADSPQPVNHNPIGHVDNVEVKAGKVWVRGWAFDPDNPGAQVDIHVYVGPATPGGLPADMIRAGDERSDVGYVYPAAGSYHGFAHWMDVLETGRQTVYVYAINIGEGSNQLIGTWDVDFYHNPTGALEEVVVKAGKIRVSGWAFDLDNPKEQVDIHVYVGPAEPGKSPAAVIKAGEERVDIEKAYPVAGSYHGYLGWIRILEVGKQTLYAYAINVGGGGNQLIGTWDVNMPKVSTMQMRPWTGKSPMGEETNTFKQGTYCYLNYELLDKDTQKKWDDLCASDYKVEMTVYNPDGSILDSEAYQDDEHYMSCQVQESGTYKCAIKISGDWTGQWEDTFKVLPQTEKGLYYGDLGGHNGKINMQDGLILTRYVRDVNEQRALSEDEKKRADLDGDGKITEKDVELLNQFCLGTITEFPIEKMLTQIAITRSPDKTSYYVGDVLSMTGMKVEAVYGNFTSKEIKNYKISGSTDKAGMQNLTISYTEGGVTKTAVQKIKVVEKHVHNYTSRVTQKATCTTEGIRTYTCICGDSYTEGLPATGHAWDAGKITKAATCTEEGEKTYTCSCGLSYTEKIAKKQHTEVIDKAQEATCSHAGYTGDVYCSVCGKKLFNGRIINQKSHVWNNGVVIKTATENETGIKSYTCQVCGKTKQEVIPILESGNDSENENTQPGRNINVGDIVFDKAGSAKYEVIWIESDEIEVEYINSVNQRASNVKIPDNMQTADGIKCEVTAIAAGAFRNNKYLKKVVIGNNVRVIGERAFYGCSKLTSLQLGKKVTYIHFRAFEKCSSLKKLTLPTRVSTIGSNVFYRCTKLKTLQIKSTKLSSASMDKKAFAGISSKVSVKVPKSKLKTYKKLFRKKGLHKKAKIY